MKEEESHDISAQSWHRDAFNDYFCSETDKVVRKLNLPSRFTICYDGCLHTTDRSLSPSEKEARPCQS